jgi:hypothetical protein
MICMSNQYINEISKAWDGNVGWVNQLYKDILSGPEMGFFDVTTVSSTFLLAPVLYPTAFLSFLAESSIRVAYISYKNR